jgi:flavodoxin
MKNLVVYYSWMGNTEVVAKEIHQLVGGGLIRIEEVKQRKTGVGFASSAFSALLGLKSSLKPMNFTFNEYENVFLGAQVWAAHSTPAINTFLSRAILKDKKVYLFITKADEKVPQKVIDSITKRVEKRGGKVVDSFSVTTRMESVITPDAIKEPVSDWVKKVNIK